MDIIVAILAIGMATAVLVFLGRCGYLIARRAGLAGWTGAIIAIPVVGIVALWVLAFRRWPARAEGTMGGG
jgi:deoxyinosine 3'endonuclease (endonuclease V)